MRKNAVYFFVGLILMSLSLGLLSVPTVHCQVDSVKIVKYNYYIDSLGFLDVVGVVQNVGSSTVNPVILRGSVYSSDGTDQADSSTQVFVTYLTPLQEAPFYMTFATPSNSPSGTWASIWDSLSATGIQLAVYQAPATISYQYTNLTITSSSSSIGSTSDDKGAFWVTGTIKNTGSETAQNITVVGSFYNSTGAILAVGYTDFLTPVSLAPSATVSFKLGAFDINQTNVPTAGKITSYDLLVQTLEPILQGTAPVITPTPGSASSSPTPVGSASPSPASSSSPGVTGSPSGTQEPSNSNISSNPATIYAIVIVVVIVAVAGTFLVLRKRKPQQTSKKE